MTHPAVCIAVCTYNRCEQLAETLASLNHLNLSTTGDCEILVVDNASTDATPEVIARAAAQARMPLRSIREPRQGIAHARNAAIDNSHSDWIAFIDDDEIADRDWLSQLLAMARERDCLCTGGRVVLRLPASLNSAQANAYRRILAGSQTPDEAFRFTPQAALATGNALFHRSIFTRVGRFDTNYSFGADDTDMFRRMYSAGIESWYTPLAINFHVIPPYRLTNAYLKWRSQRLGWGQAALELQHTGRLTTLVRLVARWLLLALLQAPLYLLSSVFASEHRSLRYRCQIWKTQGYARRQLAARLPRRFSQAAFAQRMEFRNEREMFANSASGAMENP